MAVSCLPISSFNITYTTPETPLTELTEKWKRQASQRTKDYFVVFKRSTKLLSTIQFELNESTVTATSERLSKLYMLLHLTLQLQCDCCKTGEVACYSNRGFCYCRQCRRFIFNNKPKNMVIELRTVLPYLAELADNPITKFKLKEIVQDFEKYSKEINSEDRSAKPQLYELAKRVKTLIYQVDRKLNRFLQD